MNLIKHIPNAITCGNLVCGCLGIVKVFNGQLQSATMLMLLAAVLDFLDGFLARILNAQSPIGKELDSLADMVTFGVLPGFMVYYYIGFDFSTQVFTYSIWCNWALLIPVFSALRLAKFNIDTEQSEQFIGLPTPANAMFIGGLPFVFAQPFMFDFAITQPSYMFYGLIVLTIACSLLLVAPLPLIALKFKNFGWKGNQERYLLIGLSVVAVAFLQILAMPIIIIGYVLLSIINNLKIQVK